MRLIPLLLLLILSLSLVSAECFDSDEGKNKYEFGGVTYNQETYQDECENENTIKEYFCSVDEVASYTTLPCINGCSDGKCLVSSEAPISLAPEEESSSNLTYYFYGFVILVIIGLYWYWFKLRRKRR